VELVVVVARGVRLAARNIEGRGNVPQYGRRADEIVLDRGGVQHGLDGAARLAHAARDVDLPADGRVREVGAADHRQHFAGVRAERNQRAVGQVMLGLKLRHLARDHGLRQRLHLQVQRRGDSQPAAHGRAVAQAAIQPVFDVGHEVRREIGRVRGIRLGIERRLLGKNGVGDSLGQIAVADEQVQHNALAGFGRRKVREQVHLAGLLWDASQQGCFGLGQVCGRFAEVDLRSFLRPIGQMAVVEQVQVHLQQLVLGEQAGELLRQARLQHLAIHGLLQPHIGRQEQQLRELHRDGAGAGDDLALPGVLERCPRDARGVHARILVEGGVLGCDGRVDEVLGDAVKLDPCAAAFVPAGCQQRAVAIVDAGRLEDTRCRPGLVPLQDDFDCVERLLRRTPTQLLRGLRDAAREHERTQ